ncbi:hypothetical protein EVG20_g3142 [Dentipellis fragilis]|uniref:Uncharacterized protein n=1 Tax=Dentipellis fragilis TaxID=205917 RepID=A0A4Y9Z651_9AGAM|nr:hypothetical protein EVG20_g3142 [Dentipellis fragilis]
MPLALGRAVLGAIFAESIMYGICLTMSAVTTLVVLRTRAEGTMAWKPLLFALLLMVLLATVHVIVSLILVIDGFVSNRGPSDGISTHFWDGDNPLLAAKDNIFLVQTLLGDIVYMWRCYVVWGKRKLVLVVPILTMVAGLVCMIEYSTMVHSAGDNIPGTADRWVNAFLGLMPVVVVYCNIAIIWRVWSIGSSRHWVTLIILIETGIPYTSNLIAFLITHWVNSNGNYIALDIVTPHVPIAFCLIILQVKYRRTIDHDATFINSPRQGTSWGSLRDTLWRRTARSKRHRTMPTPALPMVPVEIEISTNMERRFELARAETFMETKKHGELQSIEESASDV